MKKILFNFCLIISFFLFCKGNKEELNLKTKHQNFSGTLEAADFPKNLEWLNTNKPVSISDLKGKIILLDFWTYSCINSQHVIPEIKKLKQKYSKELIVISVHSGKFSNEKDTENIRQAIIKFDIDHPVVNDREFQIWNSYSINSWPSFILIDPSGMVLGKQTGEGIYEVFDEIISNMIKEFDLKKSMNRKPIDFLSLEKEKLPETVLSYPSKVALNEKGNEIFISDTNHNRILRIDIDSRKILDIIGSGEVGFEDGTFKDSKLNKPRGIYVENSILYIADTENHSIRKADLNSKKLVTIAGSGEQAKSFNVPGKGRQVSFNSPWDLTKIKDTLYITMAGPHQIWKLDLNTFEAEVYAGSGRENLTDGKFDDAALAKPSGVTKDNLKLYFSDSEVSALRSIELKKDGLVNTLVGLGLFEFGDVDGKYPSARLQHPLGVFYSNFKLYIADTYNHKIKIFDLNTKEIYTFAGTGKIGSSNSDSMSSSFYEPSSLALHKNLIYIADTNNHLIRVIDTKLNIVKNFEFELDEKLFKKNLKFNNEQFGEVITIPDIVIHPSSNSISINYELEKGYRWKHGAPFYFHSISSNENNIKIKNVRVEVMKNISLPRIIEIDAKTGNSELRLHSVLFYCETKKDSLCLIKRFTLKVNANVSNTGIKNPNLNIKIQSVD